MCMGSSLRARPSVQAKPLRIWGMEGGWQELEQKGLRAWSRVAA